MAIFNINKKEITSRIPENGEIVNPEVNVEVSSLDVAESPDNASIREFISSHTNANTRIDIEGGVVFYSTEDLLRADNLNGESFTDKVRKLGLTLIPIEREDVYKILTGKNENFYYIEGQEGWYVLCKSYEVYNELLNNSKVENEYSSKQIEDQKETVNQVDNTSNNLSEESKIPVTPSLSQSFALLRRAIKRPRNFGDPSDLESAWSKLREEVQNQK